MLQQESQLAKKQVHKEQYCVASIKSLIMKSLLSVEWLRTEMDVNKHHLR